MNEKLEENEQHWKLLVLVLQEIAIEKFGVGYQLKIAKITGLYKNNISRFFSLKYTPKLSTFIIVARSIKVNFFFEDQESKTDLNIMMERAMESLGRRPNKLPRN